LEEENAPNSMPNKVVLSADDDKKGMEAKASESENNTEAKASKSEKDEKPVSKKPSNKNPKGKPRKKKKTTKQLVIGVLIKIGVIVLVVWGVFTFVLGITIH
jgi:preprotein translocase subunit SecF